VAAEAGRREDAVPVTSEPSFEAPPGEQYRIGPERTWTLMRLVFERPLRLIFRVRAYGAERVPASGPAVLAANHIAGIDPLLIASVVRRNSIRYMAKYELFDYHPAISLILRHGGIFSVRRGESDLAALRLARNVLNGGHLLGMFAEGTRQATEAIGEVKSGTAMIAIGEGVPIVPCVIQGSVYLKDDPWHPVTVVFGEPMVYPQLRGRAARAVIATATQDLQEELERLQRFAQAAIRAGRPRRALPPEGLHTELQR
jgi:1-acyl-sn-glycerol-3-phosphate acyltransferase